MKFAPLVILLAMGCVGGPALPHGSRAEDCGGCHQKQHDEWKQSRHSASATSPVFEAMLAPVQKAWGDVARARCVSCHSPRHGSDPAIGCVSCHAAIGNRGEANGALVVDLDAPLAGPTRAASDYPAHRTQGRGFLTSASLCGTCHEVHGPGLLEEPTLTEFRASPFAATDSCLTCHGAGDSQDHRFVGLDPPWGAGAEEASRAAEASRALLERGLRLEVSDGVVRLTNEKAGHGVPTGIAALRDIWVDVTFTDANGAAASVPRVIELGARMTKDGVDVALPTDATLIENRSLAPGETRQWISPAGSTEVAATLHARAVRASTMTALGLESTEVPELIAMPR